MTTTSPPAAEPVSIAIARQPVFDEKQRLWGYELFCVGSSQTTASGFPLEENVALDLASSAYIGLQQILHQGKKIIVNFNEKSILENLPYALPPVLAAVKVTEPVYARPAVPELLKRLKADGYLVAVAQFTGRADYSPLYRLADIISLDVRQHAKDELHGLIEAARAYSALLMASRVENPAILKICQDLQFSLFHGPFFKSPDKITIRKLSSSEVSRFNLMKMIEKDAADVQRLADVIQADASISLRLLAYLNSAAFGLHQKIKSIHQAASLLGWRKLKNWLRVVILSDASQSKESLELVLLSAQRGHFLELVAREQDFWGFDPDSLNLLGVFSLLDAMLGIPMPEIVAWLPLESKLKAALCHEPNNEYLPLLDLARYIEEARWDEADNLIRQLNLDPAKVKTAFQTSVNWANELTVLHQDESFRP
jgi:EAL and modified HD-GYP domain-containing signal transduction protein